MGRKAKSARAELLDAVIDADLSRMSDLLARGADPNVSDTAGWRPLHFAAQRQNAVQIRMLLKAGAEIDACDGYGNTPLFRAVFNYREDGETIRALVAGGADPDRSNKSGISPRSLAKTIANYNVETVLHQSELER